MDKEMGATERSMQASRIEQQDVPLRSRSHLYKDRSNQRGKKASVCREHRVYKTWGNERAQAICIAVLIFGDSICLGEKLSPDQKAPPFARGSGGLILNAPFEGEQARGQPAASTNTIDGVQRQETEMLKMVDGELVRVVEGSFSYNSPEGLPISVKYVADENGNRASFKFGTGASGGLGNVGGGPRPGSGGQGSNGQTGPGSKSSTYLPPNNVDRSYLPPQ